MGVAFATDSSTGVPAAMSFMSSNACVVIVVAA
jgi:hypothetical protein